MKSSAPRQTRALYGSPGFLLLLLGSCLFGLSPRVNADTTYSDGQQVSVTNYSIGNIASPISLNVTGVSATGTSTLMTVSGTLAVGDEAGINVLDGAQINVGNLVAIGKSSNGSGGTFGSTITVSGINANGSASSLTVNGNLYSGYDIIRGTLDIDDGGQVNVTGNVSVGGTTLNGPTHTPPGTLLLTGTNANGTASTLTGGNLTVYNGGGSNGNSFATISNGAQGFFASVGNGATFNLNSGAVLSVASSISNTGTFTIDNATLRATANSSNFINAFGGFILGSGGVTIDNNGYNIGSNVNVPFNDFNAFSGSGALVSIGSGVLTLSGTNTYTGGTVVSNGTVEFAKPSALPASGTVSVSAGATAAVNAGGTGEFTNATSGGGSIGGALSTVSFAAGSSFGIDTTNVGGPSIGGTLTYSGAITDSVNGALGLSKLGIGTLVLNGTNTYTGATTVVAGTLALGTNGSINHTSGITVEGTATFDSGGQAVSVSSLSGSGNVAVGSGSLSAGSDNSSTTFSGSISGTGGSLVKLGTGKLTLSGTNTYTGGTTVSAGKLGVDGSVAGNVTVNSGAEVGGHGSIAGTIGGSGSVGPGNSPGILTAGSTDPSGGLSYNFEFTLYGTANWANASASGNDVLHLTSGSPFTSALTSGNAVNLYFDSIGQTSTGGFFVEGATDILTANISGADFKYYLLDNASGTVSYNGNLYDVYTGQVTMSTVQITGANFADGTVNGWTEQIYVVPEPSVWALLLGGFGALVIFQQVRRKLRS